jgi:hypothetical protein
VYAGVQTGLKGPLRAGRKVPGGGARPPPGRSRPPRSRMSYPRIVASRGEPPPQYEEDEET